MKLPTLILLAVLLVAGCQQPVNKPSESAGLSAENPIAVASAPFNTAAAPIVALSIPNMHCESCIAKTTEVLSRQPGVIDVRVDLETKRATLAVDKASFDSQIALDVLDDYGFKDSTVSE